MKIVLRIMIAMLALSTIAMGADNLIGTWKYNTAKSQQPPGASPVANLTTMYEAANGGMKLTGKGARADGSKIDIVATFKYDGKKFPVTGSGLQYDTSAIKQINANTYTAERRKKDGKYHVTVQMVISADGKTMTQTMKGTDATGKPTSGVVVYERQ